MWVVRFSDKQLEVVRAVLRSEEHRGPALEGALEALDLARWDDLPEAQLPWAEVEAEATKQGVSEADVIWDRSGRHDEPAVPPIANEVARQAQGQAGRLGPTASRADWSRWPGLAGCGGSDSSHRRTASMRPAAMVARPAPGRGRAATRGFAAAPSSSRPELRPMLPGRRLRALPEQRAAAGPPEHRRCAARAGPGDPDRRPLRHPVAAEGLRRRQRQRRRHRGADRARPLRSAPSCPRTTARSASSSSTARRPRRAAADRDFQFCALRGSQGLRGRPPGPDRGHDPARLHRQPGRPDRARGELEPGSLGAAPPGGRQQVGSGGHLPGGLQAASSTTTSRSSSRGSRRST